MLGKEAALLAAMIAAHTRDKPVAREDELEDHLVGKDEKIFEAVKLWPTHHNFDKNKYVGEKPKRPMVVDHVSGCRAEGDWRTWPEEDLKATKTAGSVPSVLGVSSCVAGYTGSRLDRPSPFDAGDKGENKRFRAGNAV